MGARPRDPVTLPAFLDGLAARSGGREALVSPRRRMTYAELAAESTAIARALAARGVEAGTRVGLLMPNWPEWIATAFGVWRAGGLLVPLSTLSRPREMAYCLAHAEVRVLVAVRRFLRHDYMAGLEEGAPRLPALREVVWLAPPGEGGAVDLAPLGAPGPGGRALHRLLRLAAPGRGADRAPALSGGAPGTPQGGRREHEVGGGALPARPPRRRHLRHDGDPAAVHRLALGRAARAARGEPRAARGREGDPHRRPGERPDAARGARGGDLRARADALRALLPPPTGGVFRRRGLLPHRRPRAARRARGAPLPRTPEGRDQDRGRQRRGGRGRGGAARASGGRRGARGRRSRSGARRERRRLRGREVGRRRGRASRPLPRPALELQGPAPPLAPARGRAAREGERQGGQGRAARGGGASGQSRRRPSRNSASTAGVSAT